MLPLARIGIAATAIVAFVITLGFYITPILLGGTKSEYLPTQIENYLFRTYDLFPEGEPDRVEVAPDRAEARGLELVLKGDPSRRLSWWLGCALAAVDDHIDGDWVPRGWDQRFAASANVTWLPGRDWTVPLPFRCG